MADYVEAANSSPCRSRSAMVLPETSCSSPCVRLKEEIIDFSQLVGVEHVRDQDGCRTLHKPTELGCRWNASAASIEAITDAHLEHAGPRGIAFSPTKLPFSGGFVVGLASGAGARQRDLAGDQALSSLDFAVHVMGRRDFRSSTANLEVRELGTHQGTFGTFAPGDTVEVALNRDGKVEYRVNSHVRHVSHRKPELPLHAKLCACSTGLLLRGARWVGPSAFEMAEQEMARSRRQRGEVEALEGQLADLTASCSVMDQRHAVALNERDLVLEAQQKRLVELEQRLEEVFKAGEAMRDERDAALKRVAELERQLQCERSQEQRLEEMLLHAKRQAEEAAELAQRQHADVTEQRMGECRSQLIAAGAEVLEQLREQCAQLWQGHREHLLLAKEVAELRRSVNSVDELPFSRGLSPEFGKELPGLDEFSGLKKAEVALKERLRQLTVVEERVKLKAFLGSQVLPPKAAE